MVEGVVNARIEATVILEISGESERTRAIEAVLDTGFSEFLILEPHLASELRLESTGVDFLTLADGSVESFEVFNATVMWDGLPRQIEAHAADGTPLIGMSLLHRHSVYLEVVEGGRVEIRGLG